MLPKEITRTHWGLLLILALFLGLSWEIFGPRKRPNPGPYRSSAATDFSQIAQAYAAYSNGSTPPNNLQLPAGGTAHQAAFLLAQKAGLNDATLYFSDWDPRRPYTVPKSIIEGDPAAATGPAPAFAHATLDVVLVANLPSDALSTTTPIAWTRGLQADGTWAADSPWRGKGGYIAFLDGRIEWFDKLDLKNPNKSLYKYGTGNHTTNITEALPPTAAILLAEPPRPAQ